MEVKYNIDKLISSANGIITLDMENDGATMGWPELQSAIAKLKEAVAEAIKENGNKIPQDKTTLQKIIDKEVDQKRLQYLSAAERITYLESKNSEDSKDRIIARLLLEIANLRFDSHCMAR